MLDADSFDDNKEFAMGRPQIGIFGAVMALGGFLALRYVQRNRAAQMARRIRTEKKAHGRFRAVECRG
ncbi:hypothetical protein [Paraburkholderia sp.]|uniref:hypothetical protein n=1 Tax=Paraburkholderia sp. TaxID=1926495 RepID=UPI002D542E90|nr:hypothetical protein [Paraburkholderia sp.]HZZ05711.1 hypothetical protein [Paraburkholderia sp.]